MHRKLAYRRALTLLLALAVSAAYAPTPALAAIRTLSGGDAQGCPPNVGWTTTGCWTGGIVPVTGDDVVIEGGAAQSQTNYDLGAGVQLRSITLNSTNNVDTNISGGPIALQGGGFITDNFGSVNTSFFHDFPGVTLNGPATFTRGNVGSTLRFNGAITGTGGLSLVNNGIADGLRLTVASTYTGSTTVNGTARVLFDVNGAVPTGSALTVNGSALFQAASTIGSLAGAGAVFMHGNNTLTVGGDDTSTTFSGVYQDSGGSAALTKTGTGTLTLSGTNTYTGATTVNAGTLAVNGSLDSPVTVLSGGTLGGTGTITDAVTVLSSGTLAPGLSTGIIETGDLTLDSGSTLDIELNGPTVGTEYDQVDVTGTVNLGGATLNVVLGFTPSPGDVFTIINNDGTDAVSGTFAGLAEGATLSVDGSLFTLSYAGGDGNDVTLTAFDAVTPFATFTVQKLHIKLPPHIDDAFDLQARFTLGADSNGIAPLTEQVELALTGGTGAFTVTIPAGAFQQKKQGPFTFKGSIDDVELNVKITRIGGAVYKFEVKGDHADLTGLANPVTVTLTIGGDSGSTTVQARIKSPH